MSVKSREYILIALAGIIMALICLLMLVFIQSTIDPELLSEEKREKLIKRFRKDVDNVSVSEKITKVENTDLIRIPQGSILIGAIYQSQLDSKEVEKEFTNYFNNNGWTFHYRDSFRGFETLKFCSGKYDVTFTTYQKGFGESGKSKYSLTFSLGSRPLFYLSNPLPKECDDNYENY